MYCRKYCSCLRSPLITSLYFLLERASLSNLCCASKSLRQTSDFASLWFMPHFSRKFLQMFPSSATSGVIYKTFWWKESSMSKVPAHFGLHRTDSPVVGEAHFPLQKNALSIVNSMGRIWDDLKMEIFFLTTLIFWLQGAPFLFSADGSLSLWKFVKPTCAVLAGRAAAKPKR